MKLLFGLYDRVMYGMAWVAAALMAAMMFSICIDVLLRNLGFQSSAHLFTFTEYALLIIPCLGAPWLVREKGHIYVELLFHALGPAARAWMMRLVLVLCVAVCLVLAWYGAEITLQNFQASEKDVRSFDMPRWMVMVFVPLCFAMMSVEFLCFLVRGEEPYQPLHGGSPD